MRSTLGFWQEFPEDHRVLHYLPSLIIFKEFLVQAAPTVAAKALGHG